MVDKALVKKQPAALALPSFVDPSDRRGADNITGDDIRLPRLSLAQALSPEVLKGDPKRIDGLESGDIFSNLLQTNYKSGPVNVVVVRRETPRAMEFYPKGSKEGQGIKDRSVPLDDPRTKFSQDGTPPVATVFHEYVAFDAETREPFILSFKSTSSGAAARSTPSCRCGRGRRSRPRSRSARPRRRTTRVRASCSRSSRVVRWIRPRSTTLRRCTSLSEAARPRPRRKRSRKPRLRCRSKSLRGKEDLTGC